MIMGVQLLTCMPVKKERSGFREVSHLLFRNDWDLVCLWETVSNYLTHFFGMES